MFKGAGINKRRLTTSQKLQHLNSTLTGDADNLLHSVTNTCDKFWNDNKDQCDNQRLVLWTRLHEMFMRRLLTIGKPQHLWNLMETAEEHRLVCLIMDTYKIIQTFIYSFFDGANCHWKTGNQGRIYLRKKTQALRSAGKYIRRRMPSIETTIVNQELDSKWSTTIPKTLRTILTISHKSKQEW